MSIINNPDNMEEIRQDQPEPKLDRASADTAAPSTKAEPQKTCSCHCSAATPNEKKSKHSCCLICLVVVCVMALLVSLVGNFYAFVYISSNKLTASSSDTGSYKETNLVTPDSKVKDKIVVIPVVGAIFDMDSVNSSKSFNSSTAIYNVLRYLRQDDDVKGIILDVNSPGGGVTASDKIYHDLCLYKEEKKVPIVAMFEDMACSGGYYISMAADQIVAQPTGFTGSIGVIMELPYAYELLKHIGVGMNTITSPTVDGSKSYKDMGSMYRRMRPEERELLQNMINESWQGFTKIVAQGRKGKLTLAQVQKLADGRLMSTQQALKAKLIDKIGYREDAFNTARKLAKSPNANIVKIAREETFADFFTSAQANAFSREAMLKELRSELTQRPALQYKSNELENRY